MRKIPHDRNRSDGGPNPPFRYFRHNLSSSGEGNDRCHGPPAVLGVENEGVIAWTQSPANEPEWSRTVMRIHQTFIVLATALSFCTGCRSASVASRHDNSVVPRSQAIAPTGQESETSDPIVTQISESNRSSLREERPSDDVADGSVKTAAVDAAKVRTGFRRSE